MYKYYSAPVIEHNVWSVNGRVLQDTTEERIVLVPIWESKVSVDTGAFQPGTYRINPYFTSGGVVELGNDKEIENFVLSYGKFPNFYKRELTLTGNPVASSLYRTMLSHQATNYEVEAKAYIQLALQKAKGNVANADLGLGEDVGELRQTIQMLRSPLSGLKKFLLDDGARNWRLILALASKNRRQINRLLGRTGLASTKAMADVWLEIRYGLRPLIYLLEGVIEKVNEKRIAVWDADKIRTSRSTLTFIEHYNKQVNYPIGSVYCRGSVKEERTYKVSASVQYRQEKDQNFLDQLGLTPRFLPETLWQLSKLSFVVDWIFSVGPWLASLRYSPGIHILGNTVSVLTTSVFTPVSYTVSRDAWGVSRPFHGTATATAWQFRRTCNTNVEYIPHFTWLRAMDLFKVVDSLALIWQIFLPKLNRR